MSGEGALPVVVACGLGPAGPEYLSEVVRGAMASAPCYLRTARHLAAVPFLEAGAVALDAHYEGAASFEETYAGIVEELVAAATATGRVAYGVPGSPLVLEATVARLRADPRVALEVVPNLSFLDLAWSRLGIDPVTASVRLIDGERFAEEAAGERGPLLVAQLWSSTLMADLKIAVEEGPETPVVVLHHLGHPDEQVIEIPWEDLDRALEPDHLTCLYIPELAAPVARELVRAEEVVRVLRERCPWDAAQTHQSLVRHLLEETYEAIEAIEQLGEPPQLEHAELLEEELGDVLCQVLFHSRLAAEEGLFSLADVARTLADKLVARHPHVFAGADAPDPDAVLSTWEQSKLAEKGRESVMEGIPMALPALVLAEKVEKKAVAIGLGTEPLAAPLSSALEHLLAGEADDVLLGELLLGIVRASLQSGLEAEAALRTAARALRDQVTRTEASARDAEPHGGTLPGTE